MIFVSERISEYEPTSDSEIFQHNIQLSQSGSSHMKIFRPSSNCGQRQNVSESRFYSKWSQDAEQRVRDTVYSGNLVSGTNFGISGQKFHRIYFLMRFYL